jgi:hypothetical protein
MVSALTLAVVLHLSNAAGVPAPIIKHAQAEVVRLYQTIGVDMCWSDAGTCGGESMHVVRVVLVERESGELQRRPKTVMGAAVRTAAGTELAYVFYRRVEFEAAQHDVSRAAVLACAIAHELGHLLLRDGLRNGHSSVGLMRPCWDRDDFLRADRGQLRFAENQAVLIRTSHTFLP